MSEEVTYADLNFQCSAETKTVKEFDKVKTTVVPATSHAWVKIALGLSLLFLLLLFIALGILGSVIYKLQNVQAELQRNVSLYQMDNLTHSEKIQSLSSAVQTLATRLCRELHTTGRGVKCKPCPQGWMWFTNRCYSPLRSPDTWEQSKKSCARQNASLLKIDNEDTLAFVKSWQSSGYLYNIWLGVSPKKDYKMVELSVKPSIWSESNVTDLNGMNCGYLHGLYIYYMSCTREANAICEKMEASVQVESVLSIAQGESL
ncbi:C-type lectin domain family 12 member A-like [Perognathus longimembris pacificus]|uniref:C-type lectin domain family 12 member A-like n=1 Tax=Perognathus longimembris pacificus TaxID=214514 RepID=UPI0020188CFE|nr:C-type lectin domain family 12 member A-like [Perognathus longimembris pacificus]